MSLETLQYRRAPALPTEGWTPAVLTAYDEALLSGDALRVQDGWGRPLGWDVERWLRGPDAADQTMLARCAGPTLDVGCGPGRFVRALSERGTPALGVDVSGVAVAMAGAEGAAVMRRSVFDPLPAAGHWAVVLLADGNIGIGGDPGRLLARVRELLAHGGRAIVEVASTPGLHRFTATITDRTGACIGTFPWARVGNGALRAVAEPLGFALNECWSAGGREFAVLARW